MKTAATSRRRGTIYVTVLGVSMLVTVIGVSSVMAVRVMRKTTTAVHDVTAARLLAESGIAVGLEWIRQDTDWRKNRPHGVWATGKAIGDGQMTLEVRDADGNLADSPHDQAVMTVWATAGQARHISQVTLEPVFEYNAALDHAVFVDGKVAIGNQGRVEMHGGALYGNDEVSQQGVVVGDVYAATASNSGTITGNLVTGVGAVSGPDATVFDTYRAMAVTRSVGSTLANQVMTPIGGEVIDPVYGIVYHLNLSQNLALRDLRVYGTLLITTNGNNVSIEGAVLLEPVRPGQPALLVDGNGHLAFDFSSGKGLINEAKLGVNLNPSSAPYWGQADVDTADMYPSGIHGMVHVAGKLTVTGTAHIKGAVVCNDELVVPGQLTVVHDPSLDEAHTMGYTYPVGMRVVPGSWMQVVE